MAMLIKFTVPNQPGVVDDLRYILPVKGVYGLRLDKYHLGSLDLMDLKFLDSYGEMISLEEAYIDFSKSPTLMVSWDSDEYKGSGSDFFRVEDVEILSDYPMPTIIRDREQGRTT